MFTVYADRSPGAGLVGSHFAEIMPPKRRASPTPAPTPTYFARLPTDMKNFLIEALERSEFPKSRTAEYIKILEEERNFDKAFGPIVVLPQETVAHAKARAKEHYQFRRELLGDNAKRVTQVQAHIKKVTFKKKKKGKSAKK